MLKTSSLKIILIILFVIAVLNFAAWGMKVAVIWLNHYSPDISIFIFVSTAIMLMSVATVILALWYEHQKELDLHLNNDLYKDDKFHDKFSRYLWSIDIELPLLNTKNKCDELRIALWIMAFLLLSITLIFDTKLTQAPDYERQFIGFIFLMYATVYFSCRTRGNNFNFAGGGLKPSSPEIVLISDVGAAIVYLMCSSALIYDFFAG